MPVFFAMFQIITAHRVGQWVDRFLFAPVEVETIRLFRVLLALMLAWNFWPRSLELAKELRAGPVLPEFYENVVFTAPYHALLAALLIFFAWGKRTRIVGVALLVLLLPLDFLTGQQQSRQIMLFVLLTFCFWPDAVVSSAPAFQARNKTEIAAPPIWPLRLMQIQLSLVYGINAVVKTTTHFLSGEALISMSQHLSNFRVDLSDGFLHLAMLSIPAWLLACATVFTEYFMAIAFWLGRRRVAIAAIGVAFHMILKLVIKIGMLDWVSMFLYLTFLLSFESRSAYTRSTPAWEDE
jgi:hypothetical protein